MNLKRRQKTRKENHKSVEFFKRSATDIFEFSLSHFGFSQFAVIEQIPDCVITYRNDTTGLKLRYELESQVSVDLVELEVTPTEVREGVSYDLLLLLEIRKPEIDARKFYGNDKRWTNDYIEECLQEYARFLRDYAADVLRGDFNIFKELSRLSAHYRRQKNKEYFGTYSGASPRFSKRPTLEEVFAGAKDVDPELERLFGGELRQDKTQSRIYEAYWDYEYSADEIANYLNRTEEQIKQELDAYDQE